MTPITQDAQRGAELQTPDEAGMKGVPVEIVGARQGFEGYFGVREHVGGVVGGRWLSGEL